MSKIPVGSDPGAPVHKYLGFDDLMRTAHRVGFRGNALITASAVAYAESSGDVNASNASAAGGQWGPAIGLWQIRSLVADYRTGRQRDANALFNPHFNGRAAYSISSGGRNWQPWSAYTNGAYRRWLPMARDTYNQLSPFPDDGHYYNEPAPKKSAPAAPVGPIFSPDLPDDAGTPLRIAGKLVAGELGQRFVGGSVDYSTDESSMLTTTFLDDGYSLEYAYQLAAGSVIDFQGSRWQVDQVSVDHRDATPFTSMRCLPVGVRAMRRQSPAPRASMSPTAYMQSVARGAGLAFFGEPAPARPITVEAVRSSTTVDPLKALAPWLKAEQLPDTETAWEVGQRLASELGFVMFETGRTLYFSSRDYLFQHLPQLGISVDGASDNRIPWMVPVSRPRVAVTATTWRAKKNGKREPYQRDLQYDVDLPREAIGRVRLGQGLQFAGMGVFSSSSTRATVVTRMSIDLGNPTAPISITSATSTTFARLGPSSGAPLVEGKTSGTGKRAVDFVTVALRQRGDRYVFGAEASLTDPDPDAFDCSELVQWAAAQVGVTIPDGSGNQRSWCSSRGTTVPLAQAIRTRGALLFLGNPTHHVAISLGNGQTIEARGRAYGVNSFSATRGFTSGALVPGMRYS